MRMPPNAMMGRKRKTSLMVASRYSSFASCSRLRGTSPAPATCAISSRMRWMTAAPRGFSTPADRERGLEYALASERFDGPKAQAFFEGGFEVLEFRRLLRAAGPPSRPGHLRHLVPDALDDRRSPQEALQRPA